jgi:hypothetical protein
MPVARVHCNSCSSETDKKIGRVKTKNGILGAEVHLTCSKKTIGVCSTDCSGTIVLASGTSVTKQGNDRIIRIM